MTDLTAIATELLRLSGELKDQRPWSAEFRTVWCGDWRKDGTQDGVCLAPYEWPGPDACARMRLIAESRNHIDALCRLALAVLPAVERMRERREGYAHDPSLALEYEDAVDALLAAVDGAEVSAPPATPVSLLAWAPGRLSQCEHTIRTSRDQRIIGRAEGERTILRMLLVVDGAVPK